MSIRWWIAKKALGYHYKGQISNYIRKRNLAPWDHNHFRPRKRKGKLLKRRRK